MTYRLKTTSHLVLQIKFYWNFAMPMYLCFVSLVSFATTVLSSPDIDCMACKAKNIYYVSGSLQEKC